MLFQRIPGTLDYCTVCTNPLTARDLDLDLCGFCQDEIVALTHTGKVPLKSRQMADIHAVFHYDAAVKRLVHLAKIQGDIRAKHVLLQAIGNSPPFQSLTRWADAVMPAPSSLWSRTRGRHDLAFAMAQCASKYSGIPHLSPPPHLRFRWQKSSFRSRSERQPYTPSSILRKTLRTKSIASDIEKLLVVDDVCTSGMTLKTLSDELRLVSPDVIIRGFICAYAAKL